MGKGRLVETGGLALTSAPTSTVGMTDKHGRRFRYGAYTGGPDPLAPPYDVRAAVDEVGDRLLAGDSLREALRDLLRRGASERRGLDDLQSLARRRRQELLRSGRLDGTLTRARALLDQALAAEREALESADDPLADFAKARLDALPDSTASAVRELADYDWTSKEAEQLFQQILDDLRNQVLDRQFSGLKDALSGNRDNPQAAAALRELLTDLNDLLAKHAAGTDTDDDFREFMSKHGEQLGGDPQNIDELIDQLARQAAAAEQLMRSLRPDQRAELADLLNQAMAEAGLSDLMTQLSQNLHQLRPDLGRGRSVRMTGSDELGYGDATQALGELSDLEALLDQFNGDPGDPLHNLDAIDVEAVERALGRRAADEVRQLAELERALRAQGWITNGPDGLTLSPKALRRLGATALRRIFADVSTAGRGQHDVRSAGAAGELTGSSRTWQLGDTQPIDVVRTVSNAILRTSGTPSTSGAVALAVEDFEVAETERRTGAAVALCVDLSYSMIAQGRWGPMKQTALALAHLVATQYPQDALQIIGFGRYAMSLSAAELAGIEPDYQQGTNLAHALALAGRHLRRHPGADPVVMVVTDGEPTAHLDEDGEAWFSWPPDPATIAATVREVDLLTRFGAVLNLVMLGDDPGLRRFIDAMARRSGGRVLTPELGKLGAYVIDDYVRARRGHRGR